MYTAPGIKNRCSRANNSKVNDPIWPKFELLRAFMPVLITCKFDKDPIKGDWEKVETSFFFHGWRTGNSKMTGQIRPKFEPVQDFMPVLISCKFDEVGIHSNWEKMATPFSPFKVNGNAQGRITPYSVVRSGRYSNLSLILCMSSLPASRKRIRYKTTEKRWRRCFPHCKSMGVSVAMETKVLIQSTPKPYAAFPLSQWCYT